MSAPAPVEAPPSQQFASDDIATEKDAASQPQTQNTLNYKAAQARKVSPQSQIYQTPESAKAEDAADEPQNNLSKVIPAEAEFRQLIGDQTDGMLARFLQNKLKLMFWHRLEREPDLIFGAQLNLNRVVDGLRGLVQPDPALQNEICLAAARRQRQAGRGFARRIFRRTGNARLSPRKSATRCRIGRSPRISSIPRTHAGGAHRRLTLGLLIAVLVLAIGVGSWLIVRSLNAELKLARQKTDFVSNVSHELKTPLTSIRMFSELLAEQRVTDTAKQRSYLQHHHRRGRRGSRGSSTTSSISRAWNAAKRNTTSSRAI